MTPRSLFVIIIKVLGIYMLKEVIFSGVNVFNNIFIETTGYYKYGYFGLWPSVLAFIIYISLFILLIFKSEVIIDKLRLDKDFYEEQFSLSMDNFMVLRIGIIVAGLFLLIDSVPNLCKDVIAYYQAYTSNIFSETKNYNAQGIGYSGVKVIAAYILLVNSNYIANFITGRNAETEE